MVGLASAVADHFDRGIKHPSKDTFDGITPSCISCEHFEEHGRSGAYPPETCRKYNARPPARIIALGCPSYMDNDDIPF